MHAQIELIPPAKLVRWPQKLYSHTCTVARDKMVHITEMILSGHVTLRTSHQRHDITSTSVRHGINVVCPLDNITGA